MSVISIDTIYLFFHQLLLISFSVPALANQLDTYRRNRHNTLYALDFLVSDDEAQQAIDDAEHFYQQIKKILDEK